jgi:hypothetical protein
MLNLFLIYQFVRRLASPFTEWEAYDLGIIDKDGEILKSRKSFTKRREHDAFSTYDLMILNLKKLLGKVPGGKSPIASYAAALYLIKEYKAFSNESLLNENISDEEIAKTALAICESISSLTDKSIITNMESRVNHKMHDLDKMFEERFKEEAPTNSAGSGAIAGIGVGPDGEPGFTSAQRIRYITKNKKKRKGSKIDD